VTGVQTCALPISYFEEELKRLDTPRQLPLSFIIGDLNSLKLVNDSYGHHFGDAMIVRAAKIIKKYCRDEDVIARWGGDEFVILLPRADSETAESIIERIRAACESHTYKTIPLSIALGSASKVLQDESILTVIKDAEESMYKRKMSEKKDISGSIILSLETALSAKSFETKEHIERIKKLAVKLGKKLNLPEDLISELSLLATLHDIGKVAIPESILTKEGNLNKKEWELVRKHPEIGSNIASSSPQTAHIAGGILAAHEYWDGSGYPKGLMGEDIPVISRLVHIIDAFDVMRNGRPYKKPLSKAAAIKELRSRAGTQFDPLLTEEFISMMEQ
jgi:diguanylate cyclase (GGDEF)-like protein